MSRYGERDGIGEIVCDLFDAAKRFELRMPELFCGFARDPGEPPIAYPAACLPQAWAAGSAFMAIQACLGLTIDAERAEVRLVRPVLPRGVDRLTVEGLSVGGARLDLHLQRLGEGVAIAPGVDPHPAVSIVLEG